MFTTFGKFLCFDDDFLPKFVLEDKVVDKFYFRLLTHLTVLKILKRTREKVLMFFKKSTEAFLPLHLSRFALFKIVMNVTVSFSN